jgi:RNA polymerase sigma-70 factor (sigma-E family)
MVSVEVLRLSADDVVAAVIREGGDRLQRFAFQLTHDPQVAEDLVQEALTRAYQQWKAHPGESVNHPIAYVRRCVLNEYLGRRRHQWQLLMSLDVLEPASDDVARTVTERDAMWRALAQLSPRQRSVLVLRYYERVPDGEIAELLGCRPATVRSSAARGLAQLRKATVQGASHG